MVQEPLQPLLEAGQLVDEIAFQDFDGEDRDDADDRTNLQLGGTAVGEDLVVIEAVFFVLKSPAAEAVGGVGDGDKVFEELAGHVLIDLVFAG